VAPTAGLEGYGKSRPQAGFDTRTVQHIPSRYVDWATPAYVFFSNYQMKLTKYTTMDNTRHEYVNRVYVRATKGRIISK
jgi:hypothetical protein